MSFAKSLIMGSDLPLTSKLERETLNVMAMTHQHLNLDQILVMCLCLLEPMVGSRSRFGHVFEQHGFTPCGVCWSKE